MLAAPPLDVPPEPRLGRLDPVLRRLARQQGAWPPHRPERVAHVVPDGPDDPAAALEHGAASVDALVDEGADLLVLPGGGPRVPALVLLAALLDRDPVAAVGTGGGPGWAAQVVQVRDGLRAARPVRDDPETLLAVTGATGVAGLCGVLLQAATRRTPVLLSGALDVWAAALVARRVAPAVDAWLLAGCSPPDGLTRTAVAELRLSPALDLELDDPLGAELALGVLLGGVALACGG